MGHSPKMASNDLAPNPRPNRIKILAKTGRKVLHESRIDIVLLQNGPSMILVERKMILSHFQSAEQFSIL